MTQRTAGLNLDWHEGMNGLPSADLPDIPGFPCPHGRHWQVNLDNVAALGTFEFLGYGFYISLRGAHHGETLDEYDFGFSPAATVEEAKQQVESLTTEEIADTAVAAGLEPVDDATASRHATRRTASLDLEWTNTSEDTWQADLPAIPGYTTADGNDSFVTVVGNGHTELAVPYDAVCTIFLSQGGVVNLNLWDMWSFDPFGPDAKDVMQAVDDLDVYDISHQLEQMGYEPIVNEDGEYVVASRKADKRIARMDLEWERDEDGFYIAQLPPVPGYPGTWYASVDRFTGISTDGDWYLTIFNRPEPTIFLGKDIPGIVFHAKTAEELMNSVEDRLTPEMIADALQAIGIVPADVATASRHAARRKASNPDFGWDTDSVGGMMTEYPYLIPGYPGDLNAYIAPIESTSGDMDCPWDVTLTYFPPDGPGDEGIDVDCWSIPQFDPMGGSLEDVEQAVENLSPQEIADVLAELGYASADEE